MECRRGILRGVEGWRCGIHELCVRPSAAPVTPMHPTPIISGPRLIGVWMPHAMRADSLRYSGILAVMLRPFLHVVVTRTMHTARMRRADRRVVSVKLASRSDGTPTGRTSLLLVNRAGLCGIIEFSFIHWSSPSLMFSLPRSVPEQECSADVVAEVAISASACPFQPVGVIRTTVCIRRRLAPRRWRVLGIRSCHKSPPNKAMETNCAPRRCGRVRTVGMGRSRSS